MTGPDARAAAQPDVSARPLVSIGVPAYNGARFLEEALTSALAQEYSPFEVIVSDDASSDETEAICRRFVAADPRVRYLRHPMNIGAVANFRRVLESATGTYFTWLAQDDLFTQVDYLSTMVAYLEGAPDVVGCTGPFTFYDLERPGPGVTLGFPEIAPERPWREARRSFFAWPQRELYLGLYGMFRRAPLVATPFVMRKYKGRPIADCWEMPIFTALLRRGRFVALPSPARGYRSNPGSDGFQISRDMSPFDFLVLGLWMRAILLRNAWRLPIPLAERIELLRLTIGNLARANLRRPVDYRTIATMYAREIAVLREAAAERLRTIKVLRAAIEQSRDQLRAGGLDPGQGHGPAAADAGVDAAIDAHDPMPTDFQVPALGPFGRLLDLFRPPSKPLVASVHAMQRQIGELRTVCDERLRLIESLDAELRALHERLAALDDREGHGVAPAV